MTKADFVAAVKQKATPNFGVSSTQPWIPQVPSVGAGGPSYTQPASGISSQGSLSLDQIARTGGSGVISDIISGGWWSALQPIHPVAPESYRPRQRAFLPGENLIWTPGDDKGGISFAMLRAMADSFDILRLVIETRKDQLERLSWAIRLKPLPGEKVKEKETRELGDPNIKKLTDFFLKPDGFHSWREWLRMWMEDVLVIDAGAINYVRDDKGRVAALMPLDGASIERNISDRGVTPLFPSVAYQQVVYGTPACNFTVRDLKYIMRNERTWRRYGFSAVEQILITISIALRRQDFLLNYYCYDEQTEVLTRDGWKFFRDVTLKDEFATREIHTRKFEWQECSEIFRKPYEGTMIEFVGNSIDLLVTPNHTMLLSRDPKKYSQHSNNPNTDTTSKEVVIEAQQLHNYIIENNPSYAIPIPQTSLWGGKEIVERVFENKKTITLNGGGFLNGKSVTFERTYGKRIVMTGDQYCAFMGMYLAEGSVSKVWEDDGRVVISQPRDVRGSYKLFNELLVDIFGQRSVYSDGDSFELCQVNLARFLRQFGYSYEKFIPEDIRSTSPRQLRIFWKYYFAGDGAIGDDNSWVQREGISDGTQCFTVSKKLADQLCEIVQKMGYAVTTWFSPGGVVEAGLCEGSFARDGWMITIGKRSGTSGWTSNEVQYEGYVNCVTVPNHFLFVRRNGKTAWCGNTAGNIPEALCFLPSNLPVDRIKEIQDWFDSVLAGNLQKRRRLTFLPGYGSGGANENVHPNVVFPKEPLLKDELDEWLMKVICYAFSVSPQNLMKMINRASAEQSSNVAQEEGLEPSKSLVKDVCNSIISEIGFGATHEFDWLEERAVDSLKQAQIDKLLLGVVYTVNEVRSKRGDGLRPEKQADMLGVFSPQGFIPIDQPVIPKASTAGIGSKTTKVFEPGQYIHPIYGDLYNYDSFFAYDEETDTILVRGDVDVDMAKAQLREEGYLK